MNASTLDELRAVIRKEWLELRQGTRGGRSGMFYQLASVGAGGAVIGGSWHEMLLRSHLTTFVLAIAAAGSVLPFVADTVAGERERHTLEALLATPVRAGTLVAGKVLTLVLYAWASSALLLGTAVLTARLVGRASLPAVSGSVILGCAVVPALIALAFVATGMLVSVRAASVRGAQQLLGMLLSAFMLVPLLALRLVTREERLAALAAMQDASEWQRVGFGIVVLLLLDALLLALLRRRFARRQLVALLT